MNVRVLRSARRTIADGITFYDQQEPGLGSYFLNSVMADLRSLKIYGGIHQRYDSFHRMVCTRFPYSIYYLLDRHTVEIYAVLDDRRDPDHTREVLGHLRLPNAD